MEILYYKKISDCIRYNKCGPVSEEPVKRQSAVNEIKRYVDKTLILGGEFLWVLIYRDW